MSKLLGIFLLFFLITNCSLDKKTGLWTKTKKIEEKEKIKIKELFKEEKALETELNSDLKIKRSKSSMDVLK